MTQQEKIHLMQQIGNGNISKTIDRLLTLEKNKHFTKEVLAIASRYRRLKRQERLGLLTFEQLSVRENRIVEHLIDAINRPEDAWYSVKKSTFQKPLNQHIKRKYIIAIAVMMIILMVSLAETVHLIDIIPLDRPLQLTVFVKDTQDNFVLQTKGRINITLGNRSFIKRIDEYGKVSFYEIGSNYRGDRITIGLEAKGWEIDGQNTFVFDGKPILIKVKKDDSMGIIEGRVMSRDAQKFIQGAKVIIKDIVVYTDAFGFFKITLPEEIRVESAADPYLLTVNKAGYKMKTQLHYPESSDADIRLEKE